MDYLYSSALNLPGQAHEGDPQILIPTFLLVLVAVLFLVKTFKMGQGQSSKDPIYAGYNALPGPRPFPVRFIGNALELPARRDIHKKMEELFEKYGPCYRLTLFNEDIVVLNTAPLAQGLLGSNDLHHFRKGESYEIYFNGTEGLPMLTGEKWKTRRKMISESFKYKAFRRYNPSFNKYTEGFLSQLDTLFQDGKVHTINDLVKDCIFKQSSEAIMGVDISGSEDGILFCKSLEIYLNIIAERLCKPWLQLNWVWRFHPLARKQKEVFNNMALVIGKVIESYHNSSGDQHRHPQSSPTEDAEHQSMIEVMINNCVPDRLIFEEVAITLAVAHDTTSVAIQMALFLLALNPEHQNICRAEADLVFSDPTKYENGNLQYHALPELKHLERCILESNRMLSISSILMRKLEAPLKLRDDLVLPSGVSVFVFPSVIHKNPEYFPNPEKFDPDRYLPEQSRQRHPYAYLAFAAGPRNCLGTKLALIEAKMVIAKILHRFTVSTTDKFEDIVIVPAVIPAPERPVNFVLHRRQQIQLTTH